MPENPAFELFEIICQELGARQATIIPEDDVHPDVIEDLKEHYNQTAGREAFTMAVTELAEHFVDKGSRLPFEFDQQTGEFRAEDSDYISFIAFAASKRGLGGMIARDFEVQTLERLAKRVTGVLHRVGTPRTQNNKKKDFVRHLRTLGFDEDCLEPRDKDGGLDILWLPPLGTVPLRPIVSVQCKNSSFDLAAANESFGRAHTTFQRHSHVRGQNGLYFVVFNDYIDKTYIGRAKGWPFIPLGLSDLGVPQQTLEKTIL